MVQIVFLIQKKGHFIFRPLDSDLTRSFRMKKFALQMNNKRCASLSSISAMASEARDKVCISVDMDRCIKELVGENSHIHIALYIFSFDHAFIDEEIFAIE